MELNPKLEKYIEEVVKVVNQEKGTKITPSLVKAIINQESKGDPNAVSPVGAKGLMQIMPETMAEVYPEGNPMNPYHNIMAGVTHFGTQLQIANGKVSEALASYNYGEGAVASLKKKYGEDYTDFLPAETKTYVTNILTEDLPNKKKATSKITQPANATQLTQAQIDSVQLVLSTLTKNPLDAAFIATGEGKAMAAANTMLASYGVEGTIEKQKNTYYLRDAKSGDLYALNSRGNWGKAVGTLFEIAPAVGSLAGVGLALGVLGVTAPISAIALAGTAAGALTAGGVQLAREGIETATLGKTQGLKPLEGLANVAGAAGVDVAQNAIFGKALQLGGAALRLIPKIPGASLLGKAMNEAIGKPLGEAIGKTSKAFSESSAGKGFERLKFEATALSKPLLNKLSSYKDSEAVKEFVSLAEEMQKTSFGRAVLSVDKVIQDVNKAGEAGTKNPTIKEKIEQLNRAISEYQNEIKKKLKPEITRLEGVLKSQQEEASNLNQEIKGTIGAILDSGSTGAESIGKALQANVDKFVNEYYSQMKSIYRSYAKDLAAEAGRPLPEIGESGLMNKEQFYEETMKQLQNSFDFKIKELRNFAQDSGFDLKIAEAEARASEQIAGIQGKQQITSESDELLRNLENASDEEINRIVSEVKSSSDQLKQQFEQGLRNTRSEQDLGKEVRDKVIAKWKKQLAEEKNLYDGTRPLAEQEKNILHDISDLFKGVENTQTIKEIKGKVNLKQATPADLLKIKSNIDGYLSGDTLSRKTYSELAAARGKLVSDEGNIFSNSSSKALEQYQRASAMRIARNDAIQANDVANFLGRGFDSKTGNIDRNTAFSKDVYEDIIDYFERDADAAERVLNYAYDGNPTVVGDLRKAYINRVYNQSGKDIEKTFNKLTDASSQAKGTSNLLFNEFGDYTEELSTLAKIRENEKIPLPKNKTELLNYRDKKESIKQSQNKALNDLKVQNVQKRAARTIDNLRSKKELNEVVKSEITRLEDLKSKVLDPKSHPEILKLSKELDEKISPASQVFFSNKANAGLPSAEEVKRLAKENPAELDRIFKAAEFNKEERGKAFSSIMLPNRTILSENLPKESGLTPSSLVKSLPTQQESYDVFANPEITNKAKEDISRLGELGQAAEAMPAKIKATERSLDQTRKDQILLDKELNRKINERDLERARLSEKEANQARVSIGGTLGGAGIAGAAGFAGSGISPTAAIVGGLAGYAVTNPVIRQGVKNAAGQVGKVLDVGSDIAVSPIQRSLVEQLAGATMQEASPVDSMVQVPQVDPITGILEYRTKKTPLFRLGAVQTQYQ